jgi:hypothetical protein
MVIMVVYIAGDIHIIHMAGMVDPIIMIMHGEATLAGQERAGEVAVMIAMQEIVDIIVLHKDDL